MLAGTWAAFISGSTGHAAYSVTLSDVLTATEVGPRKDDTKPLSDSATASDAISRAVGHTIAEVVTAADTRVSATTKLLLDSVAVLDARGSAAAHQLLDSVVVTDAVANLLPLVLSLADTVTASDVIRRDVGKVVAEVLALVDTIELPSPPSPPFVPVTGGGGWWPAGGGKRLRIGEDADEEIMEFLFWEDE